MAKVTDPAAELAGLLEELSRVNNQTGGDFLAGRFGVAVWSLEFYQILFSIIQRIEAVRGFLSTIDGFDHLFEDISRHLDAIKHGFEPASLQSRWDQRGAQFVNQEHIQPLKMCSAFLRSHVSYPELTSEERDAVLAVALDLLKWLEEHQLEEDDFIRQSLIEGLQNFIFRMQRLEWLGWGYSLESLQAVVMAYVALERGDYSQAKQPNARAAIKRVGGGLKRIFEMVGVSKDVVETADFALKAYGALMIAVQTAPSIAGLIE